MKPIQPLGRGRHACASGGVSFPSVSLGDVLGAKLLQVAQQCRLCGVLRLPEPAVLAIFCSLALVPML